MNKTELKQELAARTGLQQKQAEMFIDAFCDIVGDTLKADDTVQIMGFGRFTASLVKGREGKNPLNPKETLSIPDSYRIYFSSGQALKDKVNERLTKKAKKAAPAKKAPAKKAKKKK